MRPIAGPVLALTQVATSYLASGFQALPGGTGVLTPLLWVSPSSLGHLHTSPTVSAAPLGTWEAPRGREVVRGSSSRVYLPSPPHQSLASARGRGGLCSKVEARPVVSMPLPHPLGDPDRLRPCAP